MLIAVTSRRLCKEAFLTRVEALAAAGVNELLLREKDLSPEEYQRLAVACGEICTRHGVPLCLHTHLSIAKELGISRIHLPMPVFWEQKDNLNGMERIGVSVHSVEEARLAEQWGASCLTAGHIYTTDCKKGLPGRGTSFLAEVCRAVNIPVYAIGGVTPGRVTELLLAGAQGVCVMSELMGCSHPAEHVKAYKVCLGIPPLDKQPQKP